MMRSPPLWKVLLRARLQPVISLLAEEGDSRHGAGATSGSRCPKMTSRFRSDCLYGAGFAVFVIGRRGHRAHHKLCTPWAVRSILPHAETHGNCLPHAVAFTRLQLQEMQRILSSARERERSGGILTSRRRSVCRSHFATWVRGPRSRRASDLAMSKSIFGTPVPFC